MEKIKAKNDLRQRSGKLSGWLEEDIRCYFVWGGGENQEMKCNTSKPLSWRL